MESCDPESTQRGKTVKATKRCVKTSQQSHCRQRRKLPIRLSKI